VNEILSLLETTAEIEQALAGPDLNPQISAEAGNQLALALDELETLAELLANATDPVPVG
jgi:hypothetical protein